MNINDFLKEFRNISIVETAKTVVLEDSPLAKLSSSLGDAACENSKHVHVVVFRYGSQDRSIAGFLILPNNEEAGSRPLPVIVYNHGGYRDFGIVKTG